LLGLFGPEKKAVDFQITIWPYVSEGNDCFSGLFNIRTISAWETYCTNTRGISLGLDNGKKNMTTDIDTEASYRPIVGLKPNKLHLSI
jgi:hypothetical protein